MISEENRRKAEKIKRDTISGLSMQLNFHGCLSYISDRARMEIKAYEIMTPEEIWMSKKREQDLVHQDFVNLLESIRQFEEYARKHPSKQKYCSRAI